MWPAIFLVPFEVIVFAGSSHKAGIFSKQKRIRRVHLSNKKNRRCLGFIIGDYTTQLYKDYSNPI